MNFDTCLQRRNLNGTPRPQDTQGTSRKPFHRREQTLLKTAKILS